MWRVCLLEARFAIIVQSGLPCYLVALTGNQLATIEIDCPFLVMKLTT